MDMLKDILIYLFNKYPNPLELSKPRIVKIIYLADWRSAFTRGKQITSINWFFNHYGPYVEDVIQLIKSNPESFNLESYPTAYGGSSDRIQLVEGIKFDESVLSIEDRNIIDFVIEKTFSLTWDDFISLVYSTYPIENSSKYSHLDLIEFGKQYAKKQGIIWN